MAESIEFILLYVVISGSLKYLIAKHSARQTLDEDL